MLEYLPYEQCSLEREVSMSDRAVIRRGTLRDIAGYSGMGICSWVRGLRAGIGAWA
jgi:hypothetical protein